MLEVISSSASSASQVSQLSRSIEALGVCANIALLLRKDILPFSGYAPFAMLKGKITSTCSLIVFSSI